MEKEIVKKKARDGLPTNSVERAMYVFGPEEAESVTVWIETDGSIAELEAMGVNFRSSSRDNIYKADLCVEQYVKVKSLKTIIRVTPMSRGDIAWSARAILSP